MLATALSFDAPRAIVRRYCGCGVLNRCICNLPRPASGWTIERLSELRRLKCEGLSLDDAAFELGESRQRCNIALNALIGRTPAHALAALEHQAKRS